MADLSPERLAELAALCEKATPGPWSTGCWSGPCSIDHGRGWAGHGQGDCVYQYTLVEADGEYFGRYISAPGHIEIVGGNDYGPVLSRANALLIVAAVNALPDLLAELTRLRTRNEALERVAEAARDYCNMDPAGLEPLHKYADAEMRLADALAALDGVQP